MVKTGSESLVTPPAVSVPGTLAYLNLLLQSICNFFTPFGTLLTPTCLTGPFLSAGKGFLQHLVPKWL
jgi:hypothetical protein